MALFKKKKKEGGIPEPPDFLEFPEVEQYKPQEDIPDFEEEQAQEPEGYAGDVEEYSGEESEEPGKFTMPIARIKEWEEQDIKKGKKIKLPQKLTKRIEIKAVSQPRSFPKEKQINKGLTQAKRSLFIKLEKFREIVAGVQLISRKVSELEDIAQKIRETKSREDSEISDWEQQLAEIKARIEAIESSLESKV